MLYDLFSFCTLNMNSSDKTIIAPAHLKVGVGGEQRGLHERVAPFLRGGAARRVDGAAPAAAATARLENNTYFSFELYPA